MRAVRTHGSSVVAQWSVWFALRPERLVSLPKQLVVCMALPGGVFDDVAALFGDGDAKEGDEIGAGHAEANADLHQIGARFDRHPHYVGYWQRGFLRRCYHHEQWRKTDPC